MKAHHVPLRKTAVGIERGKGREEGGRRNTQPNQFSENGTDQTTQIVLRLTMSVHKKQA